MRMRLMVRGALVGAGLAAIASGPATAHDWRSISKANYGEFSVDVPPPLPVVRAMAITWSR